MLSCWKQPLEDGYTVDAVDGQQEYCVIIMCCVFRDALLHASQQAPVEVNVALLSVQGNLTLFL